ncbi:PAS domain S-box protein [Cognatilysobacter bugurensis]|uniref:PAS domain S-box protein n=1 Tax=Cognatilysobacter bugurensis TaxID=543356 RepID=UPI001E2C88CE|nr:PAS domain S-box protein [Lysobacter bugurensis]
MQPSLVHPVKPDLGAQNDRHSVPLRVAALQFLAFATVYALFAHLGLRWAVAQGAASPVWPAAGIAFAAVALGGVRQVPAILAGYLAAAWFNQLPQAGWVILLIAAGNAGSAVAGAWLMRRWGFSRAFDRSRDVLTFVIAAAATACIAAAIGAVAIAHAMGLDGSSTAMMAVTWYLGDFTGVLVIASLVLTWTHGRLPRSRRWWLQLAVCLAIAGAVGGAVFLTDGSHRRLTFLAFVPLIWAALSLRMRGATAVMLVVVGLAVCGTTVGLGPFSVSSPSTRFIDLQLFVAVLSSVTMALAVVADERRAQKLLSLSEARLRLALEASRTGLWKLDIPSSAMTFSPECATITGLSPDDVEPTRSGVMQRVHPDDQPALRAAFWEAMQSGALFESVFRLVHPEGRVVWIEARGRAQFDADAHAGSMLGTITDITERKRDELKLADQARLLDLATDAIIVRDLRGRISYWNNGAVEMYGFSAEEAIGREVRSLLSTDFPEPIERIEATLLAHDRWTGEMSHTARDGRLVNVHARWVLNRDALGRPESVLQTHTDITVRKRVESNTRFLGSVDRAIAQAGSADRIAAATLELLGGHLQLMRCTLSDIDLERSRIRTLSEWTDGAPRVSGVHDAREFFTSDLGRTLASGDAVAVADVRTDPLTAAHADNYLPFGTAALAAASYVSEGRLAGTLTMASSVPRAWRTDELQLLREVVARLWPAIERAKAVAALRESEARFRQMADTAPMMVWVCEADGACSYVSRRWSEFTGRLSNAELGVGWLESVHPDDRPKLHRMHAGGGVHRDAFNCELRARRWDGQYRWLLVSGRPRSAADGGFLGYIGASMDITERKEAEHALHEADRRKDEFLATLAHELRNPLSPVRTGLQVLNLTNDADTARRTREMMERQLAHMVRLIDDLLDVSRITSGKVVLRRERIALQDAVRAAIESARPMVEAAQHRLHVSLPAEPLWVDADPTRIAQVLGNLLTNAAKYTPDGGDIHLAASNVDGDAEVSVRDTGLGIPPDALADVFGMFAQVNRTLDRAQGGLGIGLALARRLAEMHGGAIRAASEGLGRGSTFTVSLPVAADAPSIGPSSTEPANGAAPCRVLVVDDNVDAAETLGMLLSLDGHEARHAHSGADALAVADAFLPDVVFLDIGMPGMSGHEVARRLRADPRFERTLLVAASGWGGDGDKRLSVDAGFDLHLTKPVSADAVRQAMCQRQRGSGAGSGAGDGACVDQPSGSTTRA